MHPGPGLLVASAGVPRKGRDRSRPSVVAVVDHDPPADVPLVTQEPLRLLNDVAELQVVEELVESGDGFVVPPRRASRRRPKNPETEQGKCTAMC